MRILFDYTDLIRFLTRGLPITGIQRVVHEVGWHLSRLAEEEGIAFVPVALSPLRRRLRVVGARELDRIRARCSVNEIRPDPVGYVLHGLAGWPRVRNLVSPSAASELQAPDADTWLVLFGSSWSRNTYFDVRQALASARIPHRIAVLVHDMLPAERPDLTYPHAADPFGAWIDAVLAEAEIVFTPSQASAEAVARRKPEAGRDVRSLDYGLPAVAAASAPEALNKAGAAWDLGSRGDFILYVSSLHRRKNHETAIAAWCEAFADAPARAPALVFVGAAKRPDLERLQGQVAVPGLRDKLHILTDVDDLALDALYRRCRFFIFPSFYEGWGLPVAEGLSHGKFGIVSAATSLREVGRDLVDYAEPGDRAGWAGLLRRYGCDDKALAEREEIVRANYRPRGWDVTARQTLDAIQGASPGLGPG